MRPIRPLPFLAAYASIGVLLLVSFSSIQVSRASSGRLYRSVESVPMNRVGLLLGTSPYVVSGRLNPFFRNRIEAAAELYRAGRIEFIIASGDNQHHSYNEPVQMRRALIAAGVPEEAIFLDYAGFRTLDSIVRAAKVFGQHRFTIISQEFHIQRALYIANYYSLDAVAYTARDVSGYTGVRVKAREVLARALALLDLHVLRTEPRFLGEPVVLP